jgi:hypothetical protein
MQLQQWLCSDRPNLWAPAASPAPWVEPEAIGSFRGVFDPRPKREKPVRAWVFSQIENDKGANFGLHPEQSAVRPRLRKSPNPLQGLENCRFVAPSLHGREWQGFLSWA